MKGLTIVKFFIATVIVFASCSTFALYKPTKNYEAVFAKAQTIVEDTNDIQDLKKLPQSDMLFLKDMYVLSLKTGEILYSPKNAKDKTALSQADSLNIVNKVVKAWQADESKTVYSIDSNLAAIVVTNSRDVYVLVIPGAHL